MWTNALRTGGRTCERAAGLAAEPANVANAGRTRTRVSLWQPQDDFNVAFLSRLAMAVASWLGHGRCEVHLTLAVSSLSLCAMRLLHSGNLPEALALQGEPAQSYDLLCGTQSLSRLRAKEPR